MNTIQSTCFTHQDNQPAPRFPMTYCSQCGNEQGAGDEGVSSCDDHRTAYLRMAAEENGA